MYATQWPRPSSTNLASYQQRTYPISIAYRREPSTSQPGMDDHDIERQAPHGDIPKAKRTWCVLGISTAFMTVVLVCIFVPVMHFMVNTQYTVAIDSVSDLDHTTGLSINITLGVASRSHGAKACIHPGMYVEVFYRGVQVAASEPETGRTCAGPRKTAELPVVARSLAVPQLEHALESLEADMRQGVAVLHTTLYVPEGSYGGNSAMGSLLVDCLGTRVGDPAVTCASPNQS